MADTVATDRPARVATVVSVHPVSVNLSCTKLDSDGDASVGYGSSGTRRG
jgi:hypothetical protein